LKDNPIFSALISAVQVDLHHVAKDAPMRMQLIGCFAQHAIRSVRERIFPIRQVHLQRTAKELHFLAERVDAFGIIRDLYGTTVLLLGFVPAETRIRLPDIPIFYWI
jgi:hypothetical protein